MANCTNYQNEENMEDSLETGRLAGSCRSGRKKKSSEKIESAFVLQNPSTSIPLNISLLNHAVPSCQYRKASSECDPSSEPPRLAASPLVLIDIQGSMESVLANHNKLAAAKSGQTISPNAHSPCLASSSKNPREETFVDVDGVIEWRRVESYNKAKDNDSADRERKCTFHIGCNELSGELKPLGVSRNGGGCLVIRLIANESNGDGGSDKAGASNGSANSAVIREKWGSLPSSLISSSNLSSSSLSYILQGVETQKLLFEKPPILDSSKYLAKPSITQEKNYMSDSALVNFKKPTDDDVQAIDCDVHIADNGCLGRKEEMMKGATANRRGNIVEKKLMDGTLNASSTVDGLLPTGCDEVWKVAASPFFDSLKHAWRLINVRDPVLLSSLLDDDYADDGPCRTYDEADDLDHDEGSKINIDNQIRPPQERKGQMRGKKNEMAKACFKLPPTLRLVLAAGFNGKRGGYQKPENTNVVESNYSEACDPEEQDNIDDYGDGNDGYDSEVKVVSKAEEIGSFGKNKIVMLCTNTKCYTLEKNELDSSIMIGLRFQRSQILDGDDCPRQISCDDESLTCTSDTKDSAGDSTMWDEGDSGGARSETLENCPATNRSSRILGLSLVGHCSSMVEMHPTVGQTQQIDWLLRISCCLVARSVSALMSKSSFPSRSTSSTRSSPSSMRNFLYHLRRLNPYHLAEISHEHHDESSIDRDHHLNEDEKNFHDEEGSDDHQHKERMAAEIVLKASLPSSFLISSVQSSTVEICSYLMGVDDDSMLMRLCSSCVVVERIEERTEVADIPQTRAQLGPKKEAFQKEMTLIFRDSSILKLTSIGKTENGDCARDIIGDGRGDDALNPHDQCADISRKLTVGPTCLPRHSNIVHFPEYRPVFFSFVHQASSSPLSHCLFIPKFKRYIPFPPRLWTILAQEILEVAALEGLFSAHESIGGVTIERMMIAMEVRQRMRVGHEEFDTSKKRERNAERRRRDNNCGSDNSVADRSRKNMNDYENSMNDIDSTPLRESRKNIFSNVEAKHSLTLPSPIELSPGCLFQILTKFCDLHLPDHFYTRKHHGKNDRNYGEVDTNDSDDPVVDRNFAGANCEPKVRHSSGVLAPLFASCGFVNTRALKNPFSNEKSAPLSLSSEPASTSSKSSCKTRPCQPQDILNHYESFLCDSESIKKTIVCVSWVKLHRLFSFDVFSERKEKEIEQKFHDNLHRIKKEHQMGQNTAGTDPLAAFLHFCDSGVSVDDEGVGSCGAPNGRGTSKSAQSNCRRKINALSSFSSTIYLPWPLYPSAIETTVTETQNHKSSTFNFPVPSQSLSLFDPSSEAGPSPTFVLQSSSNPSTASLNEAVSLPIAVYWNRIAEKMSSLPFSCEVHLNAYLNLVAYFKLRLEKHLSILPTPSVPSSMTSSSPSSAFSQSLYLCASDKELDCGCKRAPLSTTSISSAAFRSGASYSSSFLFMTSPPPPFSWICQERLRKEQTILIRRYKERDRKGNHNAGRGNDYDTSHVKDDKGEWKDEKRPIPSYSYLDPRYEWTNEEIGSTGMNCFSPGSSNPLWSMSVSKKCSVEEFLFDWPPIPYSDDSENESRRDETDVDTHSDGKGMNDDGQDKILIDDDNKNRKRQARKQKSPSLLKIKRIAKEDPVISYFWASSVVNDTESTTMLASGIDAGEACDKNDPDVGDIAGNHSVLKRRESHHTLKAHRILQYHSLGFPLLRLSPKMALIPVSTLLCRGSSQTNGSSNPLVYNADDELQRLLLERLRRSNSTRIPRFHATSQKCARIHRGEAHTGVDDGFGKSSFGPESEQQHDQDDHGLSKYLHSSCWIPDVFQSFSSLILRRPMAAHMSILRGTAFLCGNHLVHIHHSVLPKTVRERLALLFHIKPVWLEEELEPYIQPLLAESDLTQTIAGPPLRHCKPYQFFLYLRPHSTTSSTKLEQRERGRKKDILSHLNQDDDGNNSDFVSCHDCSATDDGRESEEAHADDPRKLRKSDKQIEKTSAFLNWNIPSIIPSLGRR